MAQQTYNLKKMSLKTWYEAQPDYGNRSYRAPAVEGPTYQDIKEKLQARIKVHKKRAKEWKEGQDNLEKERRTQRSKTEKAITPRVSKTTQEKDSPRVQGNIKERKPDRSDLIRPSPYDYFNANDERKSETGTRWILVKCYNTRQ